VTNIADEMCVVYLWRAAMCVAATYWAT